MTDLPGLAAWLRRTYGIAPTSLQRLSVPVNDVIRVDAAGEAYALKIYHRHRTAAQVRWEADLVVRLAERGAPVAEPVAGMSGPIAELPWHGSDRPAVLTHWAPGRKPDPSNSTYRLLGEAAARIHAAAVGMAPAPDRETYDLELLVDEQLERMRPFLTEAGCWTAARALGDRLRDRLSAVELDRGICHMDLTLDNVHVRDDRLTVFDFDSAGVCWRAVEPGGALDLAAWLDGYRSVRPFGAADEAAVPLLAILNDFRGTAWALGVATSSQGPPRLGVADLPATVEGWLVRERLM